MIELSAQESKIFKLQFGRVTVSRSFENWEEIRQQAAGMDLDYLRIKVANPDAFFMSKLPVFGSRIYMTGIIRLYKMKIDQRHENYVSMGVEIRKVTPGQSGLLKEMVMKTYTDCPLGHYQYPELTGDFPRELQLENIGSYCAMHYSGTEQGHESHIGYIDGQPVECFVSDFTHPEKVETIYAGILPGHRDKDLFKDMLRYYKMLCFGLGKKEYIGGARIENLPSQFAMEREEAFCYGHEWVFLISMKK